MCAKYSVCCSGAPGAPASTRPVGRHTCMHARHAVSLSPPCSSSASPFRPCPTHQQVVVQLAPLAGRLQCQQVVGSKGEPTVRRPPVVGAPGLPASIEARRRALLARQPAEGQRAPGAAGGEGGGERRCMRAKGETAGGGGSGGWAARTGSGAEPVGRVVSVAAMGDCATQMHPPW